MDYEGREFGISEEQDEIREMFNLLWRDLGPRLSGGASKTNILALLRTTCDYSIRIVLKKEPEKVDSANYQPSINADPED